MKSYEKYFAVSKLAAKDPDYCVMEKEYKQFEKQFTVFADYMPRKIRNFLWGYAQIGVLMGNRRLMIACEHMEFKEK